MLRALLIARRWWVAVLLACTLAVRLSVPAGFMPVTDGGRVTLQLCPGAAPAAAPDVVSMAGMHHGKADHDPPGKPEAPCAFAGLGLAAVEATPPPLLAAALLFVFLLATRAVRPRVPAPPARLRPPLRAPPAIA